MFESGLVRRLHVNRASKGSESSENFPSLSVCVLGVPRSRIQHAHAYRPKPRYRFSFIVNDPTMDGMAWYEPHRHGATDGTRRPGFIGNHFRRETLCRHADRNAAWSSRPRTYRRARTRPFASVFVFRLACRMICHNSPRGLPRSADLYRPVTVPSNEPPRGGAIARSAGRPALVGGECHRRGLIKIFFVTDFDLDRRVERRDSDFGNARCGRCVADPPTRRRKELNR